VTGPGACLEAGHEHPTVQVDTYDNALLYALAVVSLQAQVEAAGRGEAMLPLTNPGAMVELGIRFGLLITHYVPEVADGLCWTALSEAKSGRGPESAQVVVDQDPRVNRCALAGIVEAAVELAGRLRALGEEGGRAGG
jgi:hypothetical protein